MALYAYFRVSTLEQDFTQQQNCINNYLASVRLDIDKDIKQKVVEKVSGTVNHNERKLSVLLRRCQSGDTIFFSELSRLGRNMTDLNNIVNECCERGIVLIQCKDGMKIENKSIGGKALLFALSLAAEIEVNNIRQRTNMGLDVRKKRQAKGESWISNSGNVCDRLGRPADGYDANGRPYWDLSAANEASARVRQDKAILWREQSMAVSFIRRKRAEGWTVSQIAEELGQTFDDFAAKHPDQPNPYATPKGRKPQKGTVSVWCREIGPLVV